MKCPFGYLLLLYVCLSCGSATAQTEGYRDSLYHHLLTSRDDSNKAISYLHYGGLFETSNPDSALYYYNKSWTLADSLGYKEAMAMNISYQIVVMNNRGQFREALAKCEEAVKIYTALKGKRNLSIAYNNLGNEYQYLGDFRQAVKNYLVATGLAEEVRDSSLILLLTNNVASVFVTLKEPAKGQLYATAAHNIATALRDTFGMASSLVNLATSEIALQQYARAKEHLNRVRRFGEYLDDYSLLLDAHINTGSVYNFLNDHDQAAEEFRRTVSIATSHENPAYELAGWQGLMDTYLATRQWDSADRAASKAIALAVATGSRSELNELYEKASHVKEGMRDLAGALELRKQYELLNDTLLNEKIRNNINELEVQYQTARKDQNIAEQNLALERNKVSMQKKNALLAWSLGGVAILLLVFIFSYRFYRQRQRLNRQTILALQKEQEVVRLRAMIEGQDAERQRISREMHDDVGSGLTSILYLSDNLLTRGASETTVIAPKISRTANTLVEKMNEIIWSLNKEFDTIEDLVIFIRHSISELLDDRDMEYAFEVPDEVPERALTGEQRRNIYLVVKESVHNAIKHAGASLITIRFAFDDRFRVTIHDNGRGIGAGECRQFGNGLKNMQHRMEAIGGEFHISADGGTRVDLCLPMDL